MRFLDLFRPKWKRSDPKSRLTAVNDPTTKQTVLSELARNDPDEQVRQAAVLKLTDQSVLSEVAKNDPDGTVRQAAISKVIDQSVLADIVRKEKVPGVRMTALINITDQPFLAEVGMEYDIWWDYDFHALINLTDPPLLAKLAQGAQNWHVRRWAHRKLGNNQAALFEEVVNQPSSTARQHLTDQKLLAEVAKLAKYDEDRYIAVGKLTDKNLLFEIVRTTKDWFVRAQAYCNLGDEQAALSEILKSDVAGYKLDYYPTLRTLVGIEKKGQTYSPTTAAIRLTDQSLLGEVANITKDHEVRKIIIDKIINQNILADVTRNAEDHNVVALAAAKITDEKILVEIAENTNWNDVLLAVVANMNMNNEKVLAEIARKKYVLFYEIGITAINKVNDMNLLSEIVILGQDWDTRKAAMSKMKRISLTELRSLLGQKINEEISGLLTRLESPESQEEEYIPDGGTGNSTFYNYQVVEKLAK